MVSFIGREETGVPGENHRHAASHGQTFHIMLYRVHFAMSDYQHRKQFQMQEIEYKTFKRLLNHSSC